MLIPAVLFSCRQEPSGSSVLEEGIEIEDEQAPEEKIRSIFYNMYLPVEMARIFEAVEAGYDPALLNPVSRVGRYSLDSRRAMNLGVYGVDLSYLKLYGQTQQSVNHLNAIKKLSVELGIPENLYGKMLGNLERYIHNRDSLSRVTEKIYRETDRYLRSNDRGSVAALVVMGGWVEALYIATRISTREPSNMELRRKIAEQKYSLNSLISLLNNYRSETKVAESILMLRILKKAYDKINIYYTGDVNVDTSSRTITVSDARIDAGEENIYEIGVIVNSIRSEIVD